MQKSAYLSIVGAVLAFACVDGGGGFRGAPGPALPAQATHSSESQPAPWNFVSDSREDQLFRRELLDLAVIPVAAEYATGLGFRLDIAGQELLVLTPDGIAIARRREADVSPKAGDGKSQVLFELYPEQESFDVLLGLREEPVVPVLAFTSRAGLQLGAISRCEVPPDVAKRDSPPRTPETSTSVACLRSPSGRYALALYRAHDADNREAWLMIHVYDAAWKTLGRTGRSPGKWPDGASSFSREFALLGLFEASGLFSPVFVTSEGCEGFVLHTFLSNGHLARTTIPFIVPKGMIVLGCTH